MNFNDSILFRISTLRYLLNNISRKELHFFVFYSNRRGIIEKVDNIINCTYNSSILFNEVTIWISPGANTLSINPVNEPKYYAKNLLWKKK